MRKIAGVFMTLVYSSSVLAVDLQDALSNAYKTNNQLKTAQRKFINDVEQFPQALANFMPKISAELDATDTKSKDQGRTITRGSIAEQKNWSRNFQVSQPIFRGGGNVAALKAAQSSFRSSRGEYYSNEQKFIINSIQVYLEYFAAKEKYEISDSSVKSSQKQLEAAEEKFKLGESTRTEIASAKSGLAAAEANKLALYAQFQQARANFVQTLGIEPDGDVALPSIPESLPSNLEELKEKALKNNQTLQQYRHSAVSSKAGETVAKSSLLPKVDFVVQAGRNYYDQQGLTPNSNNASSVTSKVQVQIPIFSQGGAEYSRVRQAKNQSRNSAYQLDEQLKQVNAQAISLWESLSASKLRVDAAAEAVIAAELAYEGGVQEEMVGTKTILDVLNLQEQLYKARVNKVEAEKDYILTAYQMKFLMGQLTAKSLKLKVDYFNPEKEFKKIKGMLVGF